MPAIASKLLETPVVAAPTPKAGDSSGFADQLRTAQTQASRSIPDRPDPGGSPPGKTSTVGRASKSGPNAPSKKPDSLPTESAKAATTSSSKISVVVDARAIAAAQFLVGQAAPVTSQITDVPAPALSTSTDQPPVAVNVPVSVQLTLPSNIVPIPIAVVAPKSSAAGDQASSPSDEPEIVSIDVESIAVVASSTEADDAPAEVTPTTGSAPTALSSSEVSGAPPVPQPAATNGTISMPASVIIPDPAGLPSTTAPSATTMAEAAPLQTGATAIQSLTAPEVVVPAQRPANPTPPASSHLSTSSAESASAQTAPAAQTTAGDSGAQKDTSGGSPDPNPSKPDSTSQTAGVSAAVASPVLQNVQTVAPMSPPLTGGQQLDMVKQVANHIETLALTKPGQAVTIQLRPEGLGDVTVVVKSLGTGIEATLTASNESVRTALSDNRDALTQAATVKGFNLVSVHVAGQSSTNSNSGSQSAPKQHAAQLANQSSTHHGMSGNSGSQKESRRSNGPSVNPISTLDSLTGESSTPFAVTPDGLDYRT